MGATPRLRATAPLVRPGAGVDMLPRYAASAPRSPYARRARTITRSAPSGLTARLSRGLAVPGPVRVLWGPRTGPTGHGCRGPAAPGEPEGP